MASQTAAEQGSDIWALLQALLQAIVTKVGIELIALLLAPLIILGLRRIWIWFWGKSSSARLARARSALKSDHGIWLTPPVSRPADYNLKIAASIPIITLANLKGGVGKTTVTANLAAHFAAQGERVLVIDLDFQGSLSSMILGEKRNDNRPNPGELSKSSLALCGNQSADWLLANAWPMPAEGNLFGLTAFYDLARTENRLMVEWLIRDQPDAMPFNLFSLLHDPKVQSKYQRILIDAPPRLSTGCVQALCASTHVLIPTIFDALSAEAVVTFANEIENLRRGGLCPSLQYVGVVGSMVPVGKATHHLPSTLDLPTLLEDAGIRLEILPADTWVPESPAISRAAGRQIGYVKPVEASDRGTIRGIFDTLGAEVERRAPRRRTN